MRLVEGSEEFGKIEVDRRVRDGEVSPFNQTEDGGGIGEGGVIDAVDEPERMTKIGG